MKEINIARVLVLKRREKGITQDELATYMGVSKASVSKWETEQSYPDITFLPKLAAYFNISIDDLMGYAPQMEKADIKRLYLRLANDFANKPFKEVLAECREIVKKYYSCFPLLSKMAVLYINHYTLAVTADERIAILREAVELCHRVHAESEDVLLGREAITLEAACHMMLGEPQAVLDLLGEEVGLFSTEGTLIGQAYQLLGQVQKALETSQIGIYQHLVMLVGESATYLTLCASDESRTGEIIRRTLAISDLFELEELHSNTMAQFYLAAAYANTQQGKQDKAMDMLRRYAGLCRNFRYTLHGDTYFDALQSWFEHFDLGVEAPRNEKLIKESMVVAVSQNPAFTPLAEVPGFRSLVETLKANLDV